MLFKRRMKRGTAIGLSGLAIVVLGAPALVYGADHLDAPGRFQRNLSIAVCRVSMRIGWWAC